MRWHFSLVAFKIIFFVFSFQKLNYDVSWCDFLQLYPVWGSIQLLESIGLHLLPNLEIFFGPLLFLLSFQNSTSMNIRSFVIISDFCSSVYYLFQFIFSLLFRLGNFYCFIFKFTDPFLQPFSPFLEFQLLYFSILKFPSVLLLIFYFFGGNFIPSFAFSMFVMICGSLYMMTLLKPLSDNFNIFVILVLLSSFLITQMRFSWFLIWVIFDLHLDILGSILWDSISYSKLLF